MISTLVALQGAWNKRKAQILFELVPVNERSLVQTPLRGAELCCVFRLSTRFY